MVVELSIIPADQIIQIQGINETFKRNSESYFKNYESDFVEKFNNERIDLYFSIENNNETLKSSKGFKAALTKQTTLLVVEDCEDYLMFFHP